MAKFELYGLGSERMPPRYSDYRSYPFPAAVTVPASYGGKGAALAVKDLFDQAFDELARCAGRGACDRHFKLLGRGIGLSDLLADWRFYFFAFGPEGQQGTWPDTDKGVTLAQVVGDYPKTSFAEIGVHITALRSAGFLTATLLHELAHLAGAPGATDDDYATHAAGRLSTAAFNRLHLAEEAVRACGLRQHYKKTVIGALDELKALRGAEPKRIA